MKKLILILSCLIFCFPSLVSQVSNAKLQWKRTTQGLAYEDERAIKGYRDPATGNIYVLYQGYYNYGITRFDNSGASVANFKQKSLGTLASFGGDFKYIGNSQLVACGIKEGFPNVIKITSDGDSIWEYIDNAQGNYVSQAYFYDQGMKSITQLTNGSIVSGGTKIDTCTLINLSANGGLNWTRKYAPTNYDRGIILGVQTDNFNNIYTCGTIRNAAGNFDAFVSAFNQNGNIIWERFIQGAAGADDSATKILTDNSGNIYVAGIIKDSSATNSSTFLVKYNASGGLQYMRKFHQTGQINASLGGMNFDAAGNVALCSNSFTDADHSTIYTQKFNTFGVLQWTNSFSTNISPLMNRNLASDVIFDAFGNIYFSGTVESIIFAVSDEFVVKINSSGNQVWNQIYNNPSNTGDHSVDILIDNSGNTYNVGYTGRQFVNPVNTTIIKYSSAGLMQWEGIFDSPGNQLDYGKKLIIEGSSSIYTLGSVTNQGTSRDAVLNKFNSAGNLLWQVTYDLDNNYDEALNMLIDAQKNIHVLTNSNGPNAGTNLLKYDTLGTLLSSVYYSDYYSNMSLDAAGYIYLHGKQNVLPYTSGEYIARKIDLNYNTIYQSSNIPGNRELAESFSEVSANGELYVFGLQFENAPRREYLHITKFNTSGSVDWSFDINGYDSTGYNNTFVNDIEVDVNGDVLVFGSIKTVVNPITKATLLKISSNGTITWRNDFSPVTTSNISALELELDNYGNLWATDNSANLFKIDPLNGSILNTFAFGLFNGNYSLKNIRRYSLNELLITYSGFYNGNLVTSIMKIDTLGNRIWTQTYGNINRMAPGAVDLKFDSSGRIYFLVSSAEGEGGFSDIVLLKYCDLPVPTIATSGSYQNICPGNPITLTAGTGISYLWNPSQTTQQTFVTDTTGSNYCFVYQNDGCYQSTDTINVTQRPAPVTPDLCLVTVDSLSTHNILFWDKTGLSLVDHFNIYREDVASFYNLIAVVPFDSLSEYHDYTADPNVTTKRYKISSVDSCGTESALSRFHNTIYVTSSGNGQFNWNLYTIEPTTNPVTNYLLMRDDNATGVWNQIASTAGTQQTLNDPAYASFPNADWRVETVWNISCESTQRPSKDNSIQTVIVKSKSNIKNTRTVGVKTNSNSNGFELFPNPTNDKVTIVLNEMESNLKVQVVNLLGQVLLESAINDKQTSISLNQLEAGTYFIKIIGGQNQVTKKLIKY